MFYKKKHIKTSISSAILQPSIVLAGALPAYAGDAAIPQIFKGDVQNNKFEKVGRAQLHFDTFDALQYLSIDDGHVDGRLIAEQHYGRLKSVSDDDLIMYRERPSQVAHRGSCARPLGWEPPSKRVKRKAEEEDGKKDREDKENAKISAQSFPRDCKIKLVADDLFDAEIGDGNHDKTMGYMISAIARANDIFRETDWLDNRDTKEEAKDFGFTISSIEIWNDASDPDKYLNRTDIEDTNNTKFDDECTQSDSRMICRYLKAFAKKVVIEEEWNGMKKKVCLAHLFTHKDFDNGILGLAHIGKKASSDSPTSSSMGICAGKPDKYGAYLNTALTTTLNWEKKILTAEADLVTAHELGHNWGAGHDNDPKEDYNPSDYTCEPGPPNGKYIMYRNAVSGSFLNNKRFSPCSKFDVLSKLLVCGEDSFEMLNEDKCENYKVDPGEQCDAGIRLSSGSK